MEILKGAAYLPWPKRQWRMQEDDTEYKACSKYEKEMSEQVVFHCPEKNGIGLNTRDTFFFIK